MEYPKRQQVPRIALLLVLALLSVSLAGLVIARPVAQMGAEPPFGHGLPVQLVDPEGRNSVQLASSTPVTATLRLYTLTTPRFISFYNSLPTYSWWDDTHFDPTGLPLFTTWQEVITQTDQLHEAYLPPAPSGFYLLTAEYSPGAVGSNGDQDELLVILSRDVLLLKTSTVGERTQVLAWASRLSTQDPLASASVVVYDDAGNLIASGLTNAEGVYVAEVTDVDPRALVATGMKDGEVMACGTRYEWGENYWWWDSAGAASHKVYLYTDRPIYRPGHTVYYKGILRHDDDGDYAPFDTTQAVTVTVRDARSNVLSAASVYPSNFGTISGSFTLGDEVSLGDYQLEVTLDGNTYRQAFKVEEYRKPDYAVTVSTARPYAIVGDFVSVTVAADYYFGQPVANAQVQLAVYKREGYYGYEYPVWETTGTTDAHGRWVTGFNTADYASADATFTLAATVSDSSNQSVAGVQRLPVYYTEYSLNMRTAKYGYAPGETISVTVLARDREDVPVGGLPLTVEVLDWVDGGYRTVASASGTTDVGGEAYVAFQISTTGWYKLQVEGQDSRGRTLTAHGWFWVYSPGWGWWYDPDDTVSVDADKESYAPGDMARLLVRSPVTGTALLSLERGRVRRQYPIVLSDTVSLISLPIEADFAPNVFATVSIFQRGVDPRGGYYWAESTPEGKLLTGRTELVVSVADRMLQVELVPDKRIYHPRDVVTFTVQVRDDAGQPVVAEVSLGLVDEAIYALSEDLSPNIHQTFYGRREHAVNGYDSLHPIRYYYYDRWAAPPPSATPVPTGVPGGGPPEDDGGEAGVRRDFRDTAYWQPAVVTSEDGQIIITLSLPDNLTRWRAVARAISLDTRVGEATSYITVTKELMVQPVLPRFLIQGDLVKLRTIARNYLPQPVSATLKLSANGLVVLGDGCGGTTCVPAPIWLPSGGTRYLDWSAVASKLGERKVLAHLHASSLPSTLFLGGGDAVELPLPIRPFAISDIDNRVGQVGTVSTSAEITETFYISVTAIPEMTRLELELSSSIALGLLNGLEYLIDYPYG